MIGRIASALRKRPSSRDVRELFLGLAAFALAAAAFSSLTRIAQWSPRAPIDIALIALRAFFIPALGEELVFRAALVPSAGESARPALWIAVSTALFATWHLVETVFLPGSAVTFLRPDFLMLATLLGLACAILRYRSGSVWTAVAFHWIIVVAWQGLFGGPVFGR